MRLYEFMVTETTEEIQDTIKLAQYLYSEIDNRYKENHNDADMLDALRQEFGAEFDGYPGFYLEELDDLPEFTSSILDLLQNVEFTMFPFSKLSPDNPKKYNNVFGKFMVDSAGQMSIAINSEAAKGFLSLIQDPVSVLSHEIQHAIDRVKMAQNSGGKARFKKTTSTEHNEYLQLAHEINARFTQALYDLAESLTIADKIPARSSITSLITTHLKNNNLTPNMFPNQNGYNRLLSRAYKFYDAIVHTINFDNAADYNDDIDDLLNNFSMSDTDIFNMLLSDLK